MKSSNINTRNTEKDIIVDLNVICIILKAVLFQLDSALSQ